jgi:hypothetical protein
VAARAGWVKAMVTKRYATRDLQQATWSDFTDLFGRGNGWDFCACMFFLRGGHPGAGRSREVRRQESMAQHEALLREGRAEGALVYDGERPVGWCQFGRRETFKTGGKSPLPRSDADWRITCFVTDKANRKTGVARAALAGALDAIRRRGGGLAEAYPVAVLDRADSETAAKLKAVQAWERERGQIIREGRWEQQARWDAHMAARPHFAVEVDGVGPVRAWDRAVRQLPNCGVVGMFEREGFRAVDVRRGSNGMDHVVMQRRVEAA